MKKGEKIDSIEQYLHETRLPIVTLDSKWHELFPDSEMPPQMKVLETKLNELLKEQGRSVNDIKSMKEAKKKLYSTIVENMEQDSSKADKKKAKKQEESQRLIIEMNDKIRFGEDRLLDLPYEIKKLNEELMIETMKVCYQRIKQNQSDIEQINEWIERVREELRNRILIKQDKEAKNTLTYAYMHNTLGAKIMNQLDITQGNE